MKFGFKFSNLCGTVYKHGTILFTPDGNSLLSPVGNRVTCFDLINHTATTFPFENRKDIKLLTITPDSSLLLSVDEEGRCVLVNFHRRVVLAYFNFKTKVRAIQFSPDGKYFAVTHDRLIQVWRTPSRYKEYAPFVLYRRLPGHTADITCLDWSEDSQFIATGSKDLTIKIHSLHRMRGYIPFTMSGHKDTLVGVFFGRGGDTLYSVSRDGALFIWRWLSTAREAQERQERGLDPVDTVDTREQDDEDEEEEPEVDNVDTPQTASVPTKRFRRRGGRISRPYRDGQCGRWTLHSKHFFNQDRVVSTAFNRAANLLVVGFANGTFGLYEVSTSVVDSASMTAASDTRLTSFVVDVDGKEGALLRGGGEGIRTVHTLSVSTRRVTAAAINATGEWLALASSDGGQLLVWEWASESYVLKQQGHAYALNALAYAADGSVVATGGDDGKVKLWSTNSGFCFVTFREHSAPVTSVAFAPNGRAFFTASLDGTVRAFDVIRYRNFRTFTAGDHAATADDVSTPLTAATAPSSVQFTAVAVDPSGEVVAAAAMEPFEVFVWSVQTARLLDVMGGHEAPVSCVAFGPPTATSPPVLASGSWDRTVILWDVFGAAGEAGRNAASTNPLRGRGYREILQHNSDVLALAFRPDGRELCVATLDGTLTFWDPAAATITGTIEGRNDLSGGRRSDDFRTAKTNARGRHFTSVCYSADGRCVLAGGDSRFLCLYEVSQKLLIKKFQISHNLSLEGVLDVLDSRKLTDAGPIDMLDLEASDSEEERNTDKARNLSLPGVEGSEFGVKKRPSIRSKCVQFSPTGRAFAVATTEGMLIYSLDETLAFDPFELELDITPETITAAVTRGELLRALLMALKLGEYAVVRKVFFAIPPVEVPVIVEHIPPHYALRLLSHVAKSVESTRHLEFYLQWILHLLNTHGGYLRRTSMAELLSILRQLQKALSRQAEDLGRVCEGNTYMLDYISSLARFRLQNDGVAQAGSVGNSMEVEGDTAEADTAGMELDDSAFLSNWNDDEAAGLTHTSAGDHADVDVAEHSSEEEVAAARSEELPRTEEDFISLVPMKKRKHSAVTKNAKAKSKTTSKSVKVLLRKVKRRKAQ